MVDIKNFGRTMMEYDLVQHEFHFGFRFPKDYKEFLKKINGGVPTPHHFDFKNGEKKGMAIDVFLGIDIEKDHNVFYILRGIQNFIKDGWIPIALIKGGGILFLGVEGEYYGKIYFWEKGESPVEASEGKNFFFVANNFDDFLNSLYDA
jgi:hypothetical protein